MKKSPFSCHVSLEFPPLHVSWIREAAMKIHFYREHFNKKYIIFTKIISIDSFFANIQQIAEFMFSFLFFILHLKTSIQLFLTEFQPHFAQYIVRPYNIEESHINFDKFLGFRSKLANYLDQKYQINPQMSVSLSEIRLTFLLQRNPQKLKINFKEISKNELWTSESE